MRGIASWYGSVGRYNPAAMSDASILGHVLASSHMRHPQNCHFLHDDQRKNKAALAIEL
jgi:hypothetical protein